MLLISPVHAGDVVDLPIPEPAFSGPLSLCQLATHAGNRPSWRRYFCGRVARAPRDLRNHMQRVFFHRLAHDREGAYAALLDLFLALGDKGTALRARLLAACADLLDGRQRERLARALRAGEGLGHDGVPGAVLSTGVTGVTGLVRVRDDTGPTARGALQEAQELMRFGQVEEARDVLEEALLATPSDPALSDELLTIYRHARDRRRLIAMRDRLGDALGVSRPTWDATAALLARQEGLS